MKIAPPAEVKPRLNAYVDHVAKEYPVVITRNRKPVALLLPLRDSENLDHLVLAHSPRFQALLDRSRASIGARRGLATTVFWKAVAARQRKKG